MNKWYISNKWLTSKSSNYSIFGIIQLSLRLKFKKKTIYQFRIIKCFIHWIHWIIALSTKGMRTSWKTMAIIASLLQSGIRFEVVHKYRIEWHQMADLAVEMTYNPNWHGKSNVSISIDSLKASITHALLQWWGYLEVKYVQRKGL